MHLPVLLLLAAAAVAADVCPDSKLKPEYRELLLNAHNEFRSKVALGQLTAAGVSVPEAADMQKMEWDCELEKSAQTWSDSRDNCKPKHSTAGETRPKNTGENIAWYQSVTKENLTKAISLDLTNLSGEYEECKFHSTVYPEKSPCVIGHTAQMAWSSSYRLGCGITTCEKPNEDDWGFPKLLVCQYADQGNIPDQPIYKEGPGASACPDGWIAEVSTGLCVKEGAAPAATTTTTVFPEATTTTVPPTPETTTVLPEITTTTASAPTTTTASNVDIDDCHLD